MTKQELRKQYLDKRQSLSEIEYTLQCQAISHTFFSTVDLSTITTLHIFLPITKKREPDTFIIIERLKRDYPSIRIAVPKVDTETNTLNSYLLNSTSDLELTPWGIPEPPSVNPVLSTDIDAVLVPLVVFDHSGHRLGYGKGFYDKFLLTCRQDCKRIGISLFPPIEKIESIEIHDQKLDLAITPAGSYTF